MKKHIKIYLGGMGFDETSFVPCEVCGAEGKDIHHLVARGMVSTKKEYTFEELICVCRSCHIKYGDKKQHMEMLKEVHEKAMNNEKYLNGLIEKAAPNWKGIDAEKWLNEMRGGYETNDMIESLESTINKASELACNMTLIGEENSIMNQWVDAFVDYNNHHENKLTMTDKEEFQTVLNWKHDQN